MDIQKNVLEGRVLDWTVSR